MAVLAAMPIFLNSCGNDKWPCVNGKGPIVTEMRTETGFTAVNSEIEATLYITQGPEFEIRVLAQQNILDNIETDISGGELQIKGDHCINNSEPVLIYITMPVVSALSISGSGAIYTQNKITSPYISFDISGSGEVTTIDSVITGSLDVNISGSGNMDFMGSATAVDAAISGSGDISMTGFGTNLDVDISGSGEMHGYNFPVSIADINISGSGSMETNVMVELDVDISGSGDVYYKGTPVVSAKMSGSGTLIHVD